MRLPGLTVRQAWMAVPIQDTFPTQDTRTRKTRKDTSVQDIKQ